MRISTPERWRRVPFSEMAQVGLGGFASIKRVNRNRAVTATASVDPAIAAAVGVIEDLRTRMHPEVLAGHPAVFHTFENAQSEKVDAGGRQLGFLALLMNFAPARGAVAAYVQALTIMCSFPSDSSLSGRVKPGHLWTPQERPVCPDGHTGRFWMSTEGTRPLRFLPAVDWRNPEPSARRAEGNRCDGVRSTSVDLGYALRVPASERGRVSM